MTIFASRAGTFQATANLAGGLVGTVGWQIIGTAGAVVRARTTAGITEPVAGSGFYVATITLPGTGNPVPAGRYVLLWDDGSLTPGHVAPEDLMLAAPVALQHAMRDVQALMDAYNAESANTGMFVE